MSDATTVLRTIHEPHLRVRPPGRVPHPEGILETRVEDLRAVDSEQIVRDVREARLALYKGGLQNRGTFPTLRGVLVTSVKGRVRVSQRGNVITFSEERVRLLKTSRPRPTCSSPPIQRARIAGMAVVVRDMRTSSRILAADMVLGVG